MGIWESLGEQSDVTGGTVQKMVGTRTSGGEGEETKNQRGEAGKVGKFKNHVCGSQIKKKSGKSVKSLKKKKLQKHRPKRLLKWKSSAKENKRGPST